MGKIPERLKTATWYRSISQNFEKKIWLPKINPSVYQMAAIILSFVFLMIDDKPMRFVILAIILISDWLDGATARKYGLCGESGYMIDVVVDNLSEYIMFFPIHGGVAEMVWFVLSMINLALSFLGFKTGKHLLMPLRFFYLFFLWI